MISSKCVEGVSVGLVLAFCESVHASGRGLWCLRSVGPEGFKFGGGVPSRTLCDRDLHGGWDLAVALSLHHLEFNACRDCLSALARRIP